MKYLEIRDRATRIDVIAVIAEPTDCVGSFYLRSNGYEDPVIFIMRMNDGKGSSCPYSWDNNSRTMRLAHQYIEKHYHKLSSGDVVDIEFITGETTTKKTSERVTDYED
jgi:hypothetical protein